MSSNVYAVETDSSAHSAMIFGANILCIGKERVCFRNERLLCKGAAPREAEDSFVGQNSITSTVKE